MKLGLIVAITVSAYCFSAHAQTRSVMVLNLGGARTVLRAAEASASKQNAPSAIAVVDSAGDLLTFERMEGVRPESVDLSIAKARTAARMRQPTQQLESNINHGRTAFVTAGIMSLEGGTPIRMNGQIVGAVGVSGVHTEDDIIISETAAASLSPTSGSR